MRDLRCACVGLSALLLALDALAGAANAQTCSVEWISQPAGGAGTGGGGAAALSADGRWVAFASASSELVPGDANQALDVFLWDRQAQVMTLVSRATGGAQADGASSLPSISGDGRYVAFRSSATNLDALDPHPTPDVYRHDRLTGETVLVSVYTTPPSGSDGAFRSALDYDGRTVVFESVQSLLPADVGSGVDVYLRDMRTGALELVSVNGLGEIANDVSDTPSISWDGRFAVFASLADNLVPGTSTDHLHYNVYVRDRLLGTTGLVSHLPSGAIGPRLNAREPSICGDGTKVAFMGNGPGLFPGIATGAGTSGWHVYLRDLLDGSLTYVGYSLRGGPSSGGSFNPKLSRDGRFVAWTSQAEDHTVTPGSTLFDVYLRDLRTGVTVLVSQAAGATAPDGGSHAASISADGRSVAFQSSATNIFAGVPSGPEQVLLRGCDVASPTLYCAGALSASGCAPAIGFSGAPSASAGSGFSISGAQLVAGQPALVLYSTRPAFAPAPGGGWLCLGQPLRRTPAQDAGGTSACAGSIAFDMNAWIASGVDPDLQPGDAGHAQVWSRDPLEPDGGALSDAVAFLIAP